MANQNPRIEREKRTVEAMIRIYCGKRHGTRQSLCQECGDLLRYAVKRLEMCPFREDKPTCTKCPIHCYRPSMREEIRAVMAFAGPRMVYRYPVLAVLHLMDGWRKPPIVSTDGGKE